MLNPGALTVAFNPPGKFIVDRLHTQPASAGLTPFNQAGCTLQPISVKDKVDNTAYAEATDRVITPFNDNTDGVSAEWSIVYYDTYRVIGARKTPDARGRTFTCEFIVKKETG